MPIQTAPSVPTTGYRRPFLGPPVSAGSQLFDRVVPDKRRDSVESQDFVRCNMCDAGGSFSDAVESARVSSNVRRFEDHSFTVWRCRSCRSLHSKEAVDLRAYYREYPFQKQKMDFAARRAYRNRLRQLQKHGLRREHRVLDFGCGAGLFVRFLEDAAFHGAVGYDPFVSAHNRPDRLRTRYDVITCQDVIEHFDDPRQCLEQLVPSLKTGGLLAIGTPTADHIDLSSVDRYQMELHQPYHRHILSEDALVRLAARFGLRLIAVDHRFYYDTLFPGVNTRFIKSYVRRLGNLIDVAVERPRLWATLSSPALVSYVFFGYLFPERANLTAFFRRDG